VNPRTLFVVLSLAMALPTSAAAGAPPRVDSASAGESTQAAEHFDRGVTYYEEADYSAALVEFKRAYEISPAWRVLFNIGQTDFQLHEYVEALGALRRFVAEGGELIKPKRRAEVDAELADLNDRVARVSFESNLSETTISVDGQPVGVTPLSGPVLVSAGIRRVTALHTGRDPVEQRISVIGGDAMAVQLDFAIPPISEAGLQPAFTRSPAPRREPRRLPAVVAFGTAVVGLATGSVFGVLAIADKANLDEVCTSGRACPATSRSTIDAVALNALIANIGFAVAAAGAVTGLTLWWTAGSVSASSEGAHAGPVLHIGPGLVCGTF
jgi:hypothetical protein